MPKLDAENFFLQLSSGVYLDSLGKIVNNLPADGFSLGTLPFSLDLTDDVKNALKGVDLADIPGVLQDAAPILEGIGVSEKAIQIIGSCISIAIGLTSVVGTVGAVVELLKVFGIFGGGGGGQADALAKIYQLVQQINTNLNGLGQQQTVDKVIEYGWGNIGPAGDELIIYLKSQNPNKAQLRDPHLNDLRKSRDILLNPNFQRAPYKAAAVWNQPWSADLSWLEPRPGSNIPPNEDLKTLNDGNWRWDYTPYIGAIAAVSNLLLSYYKTLDPAFRTTRQFESELNKLADGLQAFGEKISQEILWTREWQFGDQYWMPMASGWPVGAVDACSAASAIESRWKEGVISFPDPLATPNDPIDAYYHPPIVLNTNESLERARRARQIDWLTVFNASGAPKILQYAAIAREMATPPKTSETVKTKVGSTARRKFVQTVKHDTPFFLGCGRETFDADMYYVQRSVEIRATTQPQIDQDFYKIPYKFYLEAWPTILPPGSELWGYPISRVEITPQGQSATLTGLTFDYEVKPSKLRVAVRPSVKKALDTLRADKFVKIAESRPNLLPIMNPWGLLHSPLDVSNTVAFSDPYLPGVMTNKQQKSLTIDYSLRIGDGYINVEFGNRPAEGNFGAVFFVIEELVNSDTHGNPGPILRTLTDISMVGVELHLPQEYFDYIELCTKRQRGIVDEINRKHIAVKKKPTPQPDPYRYESLGEWVSQVMRENPGLLKGELLREAKKLAQIQVPRGTTRS